MKYPIILGHRSKDTLKAEVYHKNASYFLLGELRIFIKQKAELQRIEAVKRHKERQVNLAEEEL